MKATKIALVLVLVSASVALAARCEKCFKHVPDGRKFCPACAAKAQADKLDGMDERALIVKVTQARSAYEENLQKLIEYYRLIGDANKIERAKEELTMLRRVPLHQYLVVADMVGQLKPTQDIAEANRLYEDARMRQTRMVLPGFKKRHLLEALDRYQDLIVKYPDSDKVALAVYRMGEIYGSLSFRDYARAARCYEKCYQWDPETNLPARLKAASIHDKKLHDRKKAMRIYELAAKFETEPANRASAKERLLRLQEKGR